MLHCFDAAIIGGGVVGSAIARELSRYDLTIAVLEDNPAYNRDPRLVERVRSNASGRAMRLSAQPAAKQPEVELPRKETRKNTKGKNVISFK